MVPGAEARGLVAPSMTRPVLFPFEKREGIREMIEARFSKEDNK